MVGFEVEKVRGEGAVRDARPARALGTKIRNLIFFSLLFTYREDFEFHSKSNEKSSEAFKQGSDMM